MAELTIPKQTSYEYGAAYQQAQADKYRDRANNHWRHRIQLAHDLVDRFVLPALENKAPQEVNVVDVGTSIGTFAIEFARRGYRAYGVDFDAEALKIARQLAAEEGVSPEFVQADIADWSRDFPPIDIAVCFDIFEHLHDDELGALLTAIRKNLAPGGHLIFHTFPTQFDYLIYYRWYIRLPLELVRPLPSRYFDRCLRSYAALFDIYLLLTRGMEYRDTIKSWSHCNPTTKERLEDVLRRCGYEVVSIETAQLYDYYPGVQRRFAKHASTYRNLFGVAMSRR